MRRYWSPQWLYKSAVKIGAYGTNDLPSSYFRNLLPYPYELHWIAVTGVPALADEGGFHLNAGIARTVRMNLSISSEGDINYIRTLGATLMSPTHAYHHHFGRFAVGHHLKLPKETIIPADGGLEVSVKNPGNAWTYSDYDYLSALFNGYTLPVGKDGPRNPHHLACIGPADLVADGVWNFDCADLQNDGKNDLHVLELILNDVKDPSDGTYGIGAVQVQWLVNPTLGIPWMPEGEHMPVGNICPFNDVQLPLTGADFFGGSGAWAYEFPPNTFLMPRQRLGIELRDLSGENQTLNISLFGSLEVS